MLVADNGIAYGQVIAYVVAAVVGYVAGSFPTGYLVVKQLTGQDVRTVGSGGTGATNVRRVAGAKAALFVLLVDFHKGFIPVMLSKVLFPHAFWLHVLVSFMAVIGHSKSIFLNFSGGKSAATGLGGLVGLAPVPAVLVGLIAYLVTKVLRYQSLGSIVAAVCAPLFLCLFKAPVPYIVYAVIATSYVIYLHKANIGRLLSGTENRL
jgi:glycerol-3-phosphate acyltransferase PlsY